MAPTTLVDQVTTTSPDGRTIEAYGYPIRMLELLAPLQGVTYLERVKVTNAASILKTKKAIKKAFSIQLEGKGFSMVEVLSACPPNWKKEPIAAHKWIDETVSSYYNLGVIKDETLREEQV